MLYQCHWYIDQRVLYQKVSGTVTVQDLVAIQADGDPKIENGIRLVHVIVDATDVTHFPLNLSDLNRVMHRPTSDNRGWTVIIASNRMLQVITSTLVQLAGMRVRIFSTLDAGLTFIKQQDSTIVLPVREEV